VKAVDPDGDELEFGAINLPQGASLQTIIRNNSQVGEFVWTPGEGQAGIYSVQFTVTDGKVQVVSDPMVIEVVSKGKPPQMVSLYNYADRLLLWVGYDQEDKWNIKYSYQVDNNPWTKPNKKTWVGVQTLTNKYHLKKGKHEIKVKAIDTDGLESNARTVKFQISDKSAKGSHGRR